MGGRFKKLRPVEYGSLQPGDGQLMSARARHGILIGVAVILSTIAPVQTFAEFGKTEWRCSRAIQTMHRTKRSC